MGIPSVPGAENRGPGRSGWEPAVAVAAGTLLASILSLATAVAASATTQVGWLDTRFVALLFGLPAAATAAALPAALLARWGRPRIGLALGIGAAVVVSVIVGAASVGIAQWWISDLPTDSNRTAAYLSVPLVFLTAFPVSIVLASALRTVPPSGNTRPWVFLVAQAAAVGLLAGGAYGALTGGTEQVLDCNALQGCNFPPSIFAAMESGASIGAWAGAAIGVAAGVCAGLVVLAGRPSE